MEKRHLLVVEPSCLSAGAQGLRLENIRSKCHCGRGLWVLGM